MIGVANIINKNPTPYLYNITSKHHKRPTHAHDAGGV